MTLMQIFLVRDIDEHYFSSVQKTKLFSFNTSSFPTIDHDILQWISLLYVLKKMYVHKS